MSPKQMTKFASYIGAFAFLGTIAILIWQPQPGILTWWPLVGFGGAGLLLILAFLKGWLKSVENRMAMSEAINLCYLEENQQETNKMV